MMANYLDSLHVIIIEEQDRVGWIPGTGDGYMAYTDCKAVCICGWRTSTSRSLADVEALGRQHYEYVDEANSNNESFRTKVKFI